MSNIIWYLRDKLIFTHPKTDGGRFVLHLIPHFGVRGIKASLMYQKCIMWEYYTWYPHDETLQGYSEEVYFSIPIPFIKYCLF